jgi:hypothetical protein
VYRIGDADVEAVLVLDLVVELLGQQDITELSTYVEVVPRISTCDIFFTTGPQPKLYYLPTMSYQSVSLSLS